MIKTKVVAFYLPQYHEVEENNIWWGKGFTEWTNVKKATPVFKGHYQPKIPYRKNYYDLSNYKVLNKQAKLAHQYGIDGFCFYHYWFTGKKLLEKPIELLLKHPEIKIDFCLSWANETWSRRWNGEEKNILIKQNYGGIDDWEQHFQYLIGFFRDSRYIRIDNKPVLLLYRAFEIKQCDEMINYWNQRMLEEGMEGLYIVETLNGIQKDGYVDNSSAYVEFEPTYTIYKYLNYFTRAYRYFFNHFKLSRIGCRDYLSYDRIWRNIIKRKRDNQKQIFLGAFPGWDNTARKGKAGLVIRGSTPEKFRKYFFEQYQKSIEEKKELIFINAWNEWGEGAYLEADEKYQFSYLEAVKFAKKGI